MPSALAFAIWLRLRPFSVTSVRAGEQRHISIDMLGCVTDAGYRFTGAHCRRIRSALVLTGNAPVFLRSLLFRSVRSWTSRRNSPAPIDYRPTVKPSASCSSPCANGLLDTPAAATWISVAKPCLSGIISTIGTESTTDLDAKRLILGSLPGFTGKVTPGGIAAGEADRPRATRPRRRQTEFASARCHPMEGSGAVRRVRHSRASVLP